MSLEPARQWGEQVAPEGFDAIRLRAGDGARVDIRCDHASTGSPVHEHGCDRSAPGTEIDRNAARRQALGRAMRQRFALPARHIHPGIDADHQAPERGAPGDPGKRLPGEPARHHRVEERGIARRPSKELACLLLRRQEPGGGKHCTEVLEVVSGLHARNFIMPTPRRFAPWRVGQPGETSEPLSRAHFDGLMDTRTKLIVIALVLIVLTFMVISGVLAFTGIPSN